MQKRREYADTIEYADERLDRVQAVWSDGFVWALPGIAVSSWRSHGVASSSASHLACYWEGVHADGDAIQVKGCTAKDKR